MIPDGVKQHYLAVNSLSRLLRGITLDHNDDRYCMKCLDSFRTENKFKSHENIRKYHDYCHTEMPKKMIC